MDIDDFLEVKTIEFGSEFSEIKLDALAKDVMELNVPAIFTIKTGGSILAQPVINKDVLYFTCCDHKCYAVNSKTGKKLWTFPTKDVIISMPAVYRNNICFGSFDGNVYMINPKGELVWKTGIKSRIAMGMLVYEGRIYFGAEDGNFYCMNAETGEIIWRFSTKAEIGYYKPVIYNNKIYFGSFDGSLYCLNLNGKLIWKFPTNGFVETEPCFSNNIVYFGSYDRNMYALNAENGEVVWKTGTSKIMRICILHKNTLYFVGRGNVLYAVDKSNGNIKWKFEMEAHASFPPAVHNNVLYQGSYDRNLYAIDTNGRLLWKKKLDCMIQSPIYYSDMLYSGSWNSSMLAFNLKGNMIWKLKTSLSEPSDIDIEEAKMGRRKLILKPQIVEKKEKRKYGIEISGEYGERSETTYASAVGRTYIGKKKGYMSE